MGGGRVCKRSAWMHYKSLERGGYWIEKPKKYAVIYLKI